MNPTVINEDYLVLRIGRLTVNLEAALAQRAEAQAASAEQEKKIETLEARVKELENLVELIGDDDDDADDDVS